MQCLTEYGVVHNSRRWSQSQAPEQGHCCQRSNSTGRLGDPGGWHRMAE